MNMCSFIKIIFTLLENPVVEKYDFCCLRGKTLHEGNAILCTIKNTQPRLPMRDPNSFLMS